ncbi:MAG: protein TolQ [Pseudomonadota bacterium]
MATDAAALDATPLAGSVSADLSSWGLVLAADIVVQGVMLLLVLMSIWVWATLLEKTIRLGGLHGKATRFEETFWSGGGLEPLFDKIGARPKEPMSALFVAGMREWKRSASKGLTATEAMRNSLRARVDRAMDVALSREMAQLEKRLSFLATVGSAAPFIGLFGTVWGIMNAFTAIAGSQNTSLAVVAPGIAEALIATALGLFAAIPASVGYNLTTSALGRYARRLENFSDEFAALLSRQLEERGA